MCSSVSTRVFGWQLVARNRQEYIDMGKALALQSKISRKGSQHLLTRFHLQLETGRVESVLFDIDSYVRSYESLMSAVWDKYMSNIDGASASSTSGTSNRNTANLGLHHVAVVRR